MAGSVQPFQVQKIPLTISRSLLSMIGAALLVMLVWWTVTALAGSQTYFRIARIYLYRSPIKLLYYRRAILPKEKSAKRRLSH